MKKCWKLTPSERPTFTELVATLDKTLMSVAGYTELGMTLVEEGGEEEEGWEAEPVEPPHEAGQGELLALYVSTFSERISNFVLHLLWMDIYNYSLVNIAL